MSRTVLTYPDLPPVMTQAAADTRYVNVAGDEMTGHLGLKATPQAWHPDWVALELGRVGVVRADTSATSVTLALQANGVYDAGGVGRAKITGGSTLQVMSTTAWSVYTAPSVAAGAVQSYLPRLTMDLTGEITLQPDAGKYLYLPNADTGLRVGNHRWHQLAGSGHNVFARWNGSAWVDQIRMIYSVPGVYFQENPMPYADKGATCGTNSNRWSTVYTDQVSAGAPGVALVLGTTSSLQISFGGYGHPLTDNSMNWGHPSYRWGTIYAVSGAINTSTREAKNDLGLVDPEEALAEVLRVPVHRFTYKQEPRDYSGVEEEAERRRLFDLDEAGRVYEEYERIGFMAEEATIPDGDALLLVGPDSVEPQNTAGVLMAALQALAKRVQALEAARV